MCLFFCIAITVPTVPRAIPMNNPFFIKTSAISMYNAEAFFVGNVYRRKVRLFVDFCEFIHRKTEFIEVDVFKNDIVNLVF